MTRFVFADHGAPDRVIDTKLKTLTLQIDVLVKIPNHLAYRRMSIVEHLAAKGVHVIGINQPNHDSPRVE